MRHVARRTAGAAREEGHLGHAQGRWGRKGAGALMLPAQGPRAHRELLVPPGTQEPRRDAGAHCERRGGVRGRNRG